MTGSAFALGAVAAFLVGFGKMGLPGAIILSVPLFAQVFGGRLAVGGVLPLLILGDVMAVSVHRAHADLTALRRLLPAVVVGLVGGAALQWVINAYALSSKVFSVSIGLVILFLLLVTVLRERGGQALQPHSPRQTALLGVLTGLTTQIANAAGPVMTIYTTGLGLKKAQLIGTVAWSFLIINSLKIPLLLVISWIQPEQPLWSWSLLGQTLWFVPFLLLGSGAGWLFFRRVPETYFKTLILALAGIAALWLVIAPK